MSFTFWDDQQEILNFYDVLNIFLDAPVQKNDWNIF